MRAAPSSPDGSAEAAGDAEDVVAGLGTGRGLFPGPTVAAGRNHGDGVSGGNGFMTGPGVVGAICPDLADGPVIRNLRRQLGQHGRIADTRPGDLGHPDVQRFRVNSKVNPAPLPWL